MVDIKQKNLSGLLFIGDPHMGSRTPSTRLDKNFNETVENKLIQAAEICKKKNLFPIILGDLIDRNNDYQPEMVYSLVNALQQFPYTPIMPLGNHDKKYNILTPEDVLYTIQNINLIDIIPNNRIWGGLHFINNKTKNKDEFIVYIGGTHHGNSIPKDVTDLKQNQNQDQDENQDQEKKNSTIKLKTKQIKSNQSKNNKSDAKEQKFEKSEMIIWLTHHDMDFISHQHWANDQEQNQEEQNQEEQNQEEQNQEEQNQEEIEQENDEKNNNETNNDKKIKEKQEVSNLDNENKIEDENNKTNKNDNGTILFPIHDIKGVDWVINGHLHKQFDDVVCHSTIWTNPGNITRRRISEQNHIPRVWEWVANKTSFNNKKLKPHKLDYENKIFRSVVDVKDYDPIIDSDTEYNFVNELKNDINNKKTNDASMLRQSINNLFEAEDLTDISKELILKLWQEVSGQDSTDNNL